MTVWTDFVKDFAKRNNTTYGCALSMPECKAEYHAKKPQKLTKKQQKENESMGAEDTPAPVSAKSKQHKERTTSLKSKVQKKQVEKQLVETVGMKGEDKDVPAPPAPGRSVSQSDPTPPPKKKGGRPKKYATAEEAKKAKKLMTEESNKRRKEAKKAETTKEPAVPITAVQQVASANDPLKKAQKEFDDFNYEIHEDLYNEVGQLKIPKKQYYKILKDETDRLAEKYGLKKNWFSGKGLEGEGDFFKNIGRAFTSSWNNQGSPAERKATSVLLNKIEPALIKPLQVLAPPVGEIANAQREGLKEHYGLGVPAKKRGRPPKVVGGATPEQMGTASVLRTYTLDDIFFALNDITHSADSIVSLVDKWNKATNSAQKNSIEGQIQEMLQNPYRITDPATGQILLSDPGNKAQETIDKALRLIFGSTKLPPVISKVLKRFRLPNHIAKTLPRRGKVSQVDIQDEINTISSSAKATPSSSGKTTPASSGATTPATPVNLLSFAKPAKVKGQKSSPATKPPGTATGLKVGYSAEATGGLGHIYPISHNLILRMCEHLV